MMLSGMAIMLYMRLDIVMLREMTGEHAAGIYAAATNISEAGYFLPMVIVGSSFPAIVKYRDTDQKAYFDSFRKLYFCLAWLSVGIALPLSLLSSTIVRVLYGIQYKEAALVLAVHLWANVAIFMSVGSGHYLQAESYQVIAFYRALVGAVFNVALNVFLIPSYGAIGAAIATIISYFVTILFLVLLEKTREHAFLMLKAPFSRKY